MMYWVDCHDLLQHGYIIHSLNSIIRTKELVLFVSSGCCFSGEFKRLANKFVTTISREETAWEGILMSSCERDADALYCPSSI